MIYVCEHHNEMLGLWHQQDRKAIRLLHVDFHDDLRGLLVHRKRGRAWAIGDLARGCSPDPGNFLAHAVLEGRLDRVRWVRDEPGGRAWDIGVVKYATDLTALPERIRHALSSRIEHPFVHDEVLLDEWTGLEDGEELSLDWDCFASLILDPDRIDERVDLFCERMGGVIPAQTCISYSPEYSHPTLDSFKRFVSRLEARFGQGVTWLSEGLLAGRTTHNAEDPIPSGRLKRAMLWLRRHGIY